MFVLIFWSYIKKRLYQKDNLNVRFHDVRAWLKATAIHLLPNITQIKDNQTMKFGYLKKKITREIFFFKNHAENWKRRLVPDLSLFFKNALYVVKARSLQLRINTI